jgi:hypothetical protein
MLPLSAAITRPTHACALSWASSAGLGRAAAGRRSKAGRLSATALRALTRCAAAATLASWKGQCNAACRRATCSMRESHPAAATSAPAAAAAAAAPLCMQQQREAAGALVAGALLADTMAEDAECPLAAASAAAEVACLPARRRGLWRCRWGRGLRLGAIRWYQEGTAVLQQVAARCGGM